MQHAQACGQVPSATTVGLVPLGTGSDFRRTLGWPSDPGAALQRVAAAAAAGGRSSTATGAASSTARTASGRSRGAGAGGAGGSSSAGSWSPTPLDVLKLTCQSGSGTLTRYCINICSCGVSAETAAGIRRRQWLGPTLAYTLASAQVGACWGRGGV